MKCRIMIHMTRGRFFSVFRTVATSVLLTAFLSGCGATSFQKNGATPGPAVDTSGAGVFEAGSTMARIQERGKLNVGTSFNLGPFASQNEVTGSPEGFDVDLAKWIATGIFGTNIEGKITFIELDPRDRELALEQGKVDIVIGRYDVSAARKRFVDFAGPYYVTHQVVFVVGSDVPNGIPVSSFIGLNGRKVCVVRGSTNVEALTVNLPAVDTSMVQNTVAECGVALMNGSVAAVAADAVDATPYLATAGPSVRVLVANYGALPYGVGIRKTVSDLREFVNNRISAWSGYGASQSQFLSNVPGSGGQPVVDRY